MTLEEQLRRAVEKLEASEIPYALAGGLAASIYGEERVTKDIDFAIGGERNPIAAGKQMLSELGLTVSIAREADLDGGPLFAIKRQKTREMILVGRDPERRAPGVDLLLPSNPWVNQALERAQENALDFGDRKIPTVTVEDMIVCKLLSSRRANREQDVLDLRSIFRAGHELDFIYLAARMKEFGATVPKSVEPDAPIEVLELSRRIARGERRRVSKRD